MSPLPLNRGNYQGESPYRSGTSCSGCIQETCENNLCRKCSYNRKTLILPKTTLLYDCHFFSQETLPAMHCRVSISQSEFTVSTASLHSRLEQSGCHGFSRCQSKADHVAQDKEKKSALFCVVKTRKPLKLT